VEISLGLPFLCPGNHWALVFTTGLRLYLHLAFGFALQEHFDRLARVDSSELGVVLKHLRGNFSCDFVLFIHSSLTGSSRSIPFFPGCSLGSGGIFALNIGGV
jgi:hypothetical protein